MLLVEFDKHCVRFAEQMALIVKSMSGLDAQVGEVQVLEDFDNDKDFYSAIMITGSYYGEYILAIKKDFALNFVGIEGANLTEQSFHDNFEDIKATFGECLNIVSGSILSELKNDTDLKLNLTAPRFYVGKLYHPGLKVAKVSLQIDNKNFMDCLFYVDTMRLDIDKAFKEALERLVSSYKKLKETHELVVKQQSKIIHAEKVASLGVLSAGVAHNLNTPLGTISISSYIIESHLAAENFSKEDVLKTIHIINRTISKMSDMIKTLREFSSGQEIKIHKKINMLELVNQTVVKFKALFNVNEDLKIDVSSTGKNDDFLAEGSGEALSKALVCVLQNSLEAINANQIEQEAANPWIQIHLRGSVNKVIVEVSNSGPKIDPLLAQKVFDPFYTLKDPTHSGLGLTFTKGIVEGHGGEVKFDNSKNNTTCQIELPKTQSILKKEENVAVQ